MGVGAFAGIALFAIGAVDVLVTGGFDFPDRSAPSHSEQPSAYVRVVDAAEYVGAQVQRISWDDTFGISDAQAATTEELVGENDGSQPSDAAQTSDDQLMQAVADLYAEQPSDAQAYAEEPYPEDASSEDYPADDEKLASVSENASPW